MHWASESCNIIYAGDSLPSQSFSLLTSYSYGRDLDFAIWFCFVLLLIPLSRVTRPLVCLKTVLLYVADNHEPALQAKTPSPHLQLPARVKMPARAWFVQEPGQGKAWRDGRESSFWGFLMLAFYRFIFRVIKAISWEGGLRLFLF